MMGYRLLFAVSFLSLLAVAGCGSSTPVVATVGSEKLTLSEFEDNYARNNGGWEAATGSSVEDRQKFLDLLVKFKLKVRQARDLGLMRDTAVQNELESYRLSVAQSYMLDKELIEPHVRQMYDRKREQIRASHILIRLAANALPADTLVAYRKALSVIDQVSKLSFDSLARLYSEDPSVAQNRGDLGYFSSGRMVPEFEEAAYILKPGEYSRHPVRTPYGYHVIKVIARRPNEGSIRISHILMRFAPSRQDTASIRDSIWMVYRKLKQGAPFGEVAMRYSQDPGSAWREGDIGFYERDRLPLSLSDLLFNTPKDSITQPTGFDYGFHIFKVTDTKPLPSFAETEKDLKQQYQQQRYSADYQEYVNDLKKRYGLTFDVVLLHALTSSFDSTKTANDSRWSDTLGADMLRQTLFTVAGKPFTVREFVDKVNGSAEFKAYNLTPGNVELLVHRMTEMRVLEEHARHAPERHEQLAKLMKEYEDGILLYRVEQDEVWKKVTVNDSILRTYYQTQKEKYRWPERVNFAEIYVISDSVAKAAHWKAQYVEDFLSVAEEYTMRPGYREKLGVWGFQPLATNDLSLRASSMTVDSVTPPFRYESGWSIVKLLARDSARVKTFEEAGPELASSYQEQASKQREQEWLEQLKKKYPVSINKEILVEAFKRKHSD